MGRPSKRDERRIDIVRALSEVLARHGLGGATIVRVAHEAGVSPGLLHHHFEDKDAMGLVSRAQVKEARGWSALFAEAARMPALASRVRAFVDTELVSLRVRAGLSEHDAAAVLAFVTAALVLGAFAPKRAAGFAAPGLRALLSGLSAATKADAQVSARASRRRRTRSPRPRRSESAC
jgi:TetR/AcrR family transcriptional repressor of bet genes